MKKLKLTKVIAGTLIAASVLALNPIGASAEWKKNSTGWWYTEGSSWNTGWKLIDGSWYYFYSDGYMAKDTTINGYYLNSSGAWTNFTPTGTKVTLNDVDYSKKIVAICTRIEAWGNSFIDMTNKIKNDNSYILSDTCKQDMRDRKNEIDAIYKEISTFSPSDKFTAFNNAITTYIKLLDESTTYYTEGISEKNLTKIQKGDELMKEAKTQAIKLTEVINELKQKSNK